MQKIPRRCLVTIALRVVVSLVFSVASVVRFAFGVDQITLLRATHGGSSLGDRRLWGGCQFEHKRRLTAAYFLFLYHPFVCKHPRGGYKNKSPQFLAGFCAQIGRGD